MKIIKQTLTCRVTDNNHGVSNRRSCFCTLLIMSINRKKKTVRKRKKEKKNKIQIIELRIHQTTLGKERQ